MSQSRRTPLAHRLHRPPQAIAPFEPGDPSRGYYNDLTVELIRYGPSAKDARIALEAMTRERRLANPIDIAQLGLAAFQRAHLSPDWPALGLAAARWLAADLDEQGRLAFHFALPHTYELAPPWYSAMAQGEATSLLVRATLAFDDGALAAAAERTTLALVDPALGLIVQTPEGPVLQEYATTPESHVLNGWIFALWGLYDVSLLRGADEAVVTRAAEAFDTGARALDRRLALYELRRGWSRYDLYPRMLPHVASPFYHRLHAAQLTAMSRLRPDLAQLEATAARWTATARDPVAIAGASVFKGLHRTFRPRRPVR